MGLQRSIRAFSTLDEGVVWMLKPFPALGIDFNLLRGFGSVFLVKRNGLATSHQERCAFMRPPFRVGLGFQSTIL